ncbi:MAG: VOC family protein [Pseudorhodoplanes sp.]|uniref:VOC family protein n=1 Tax=Pseudorhodoplanes sp. TaxID=1934341 RepID=UPI003D10EDB1
MLEQLRYVRLPVDDLAVAARYAMDVLGLEPIDRTETIATFRSDFRDHTLVLVKEARAEQAIGLEVRYPTDLDAARFSLRKLGVVAESGTPEECAQRKCRTMLWFRDFSGNRIELVVRPLNSGWRYFPSRDAGVTGLQDVMLRSTDVERDLSIWRGALGTTVTDYAGDAAYLAFDGAHHRVALFPATRAGILAVEYGVENVNLLMRNHYVAQNLQIGILHGPGRRPASDQLFLTLAGPTDVMFGFVAEGASRDPERRPRQYPAGAEGLCSWGSECRIPEFGGSADGRDARRAASA